MGSQIAGFNKISALISLSVAVLFIFFYLWNLQVPLREERGNP